MEITPSDYWRLFWETVISGPPENTQVRFELVQRVFRNMMSNKTVAYSLLGGVLLVNAQTPHAPAMTPKISRA